MKKIVFMLALILTIFASTTQVFAYHKYADTAELKNSSQSIDTAYFTGVKLNKINNKTQEVEETFLEVNRSDGQIGFVKAIDVEVLIFPKNSVVIGDVISINETKDKVNGYPLFKPVGMVK